MGKIILEDMEFFAYHGCFREEQIIGNPFIVHIELDIDTKEAETSDQLHDTMNYQTVYNLVSAEMKQKSHLLEHVCRRIIDAIKEAFPRIQHISVKVSKMNPPMGGKMKCVSVVLEG